MSALPAMAAEPHGHARARGHARLWGRDLIELHDDLWATEGLQVVRPGGARVEWEGTPTFVLLGPHDLLTIDPSLVQRLATNDRVAVVHVRLQRASGPAGREAIETDDHGAFVRAHRPARTMRHTGDVRITRDPVVAMLWRQSLTTVTAQRAVRLTAGPDGMTHGVFPGRVLDDRDPAETDAWLDDALVTQAHAVRALPDVREIRPGVFAHWTSMIDRRVPCTGPAWIGAGARIEHGRAVIGPGVLPDALPTGASTLRLVRTPESPATPTPRGIRGQRLFDIVFACIALLVSVPLWPLIMLAIWIEDGQPFFFAHTRQTRGGGDFGCLKFRTMCRHADHLKGVLAELNQCDGPQFNLPDDPRLLRVGRVLRRFHLDELPQFLNVLRGEMSVVGPRPSPERENRFCPAWRDARLSVRPGVTGLWQVCRTRAPETDFQEWIRFDMHYVEHRTWRLDAWILVRTVLALVGRRPAVLRGRPTHTLPSSRSSTAHR